MEVSRVVHRRLSMLHVDCLGQDSTCWLRNWTGGCASRALSSDLCWSPTAPKSASATVSEDRDKRPASAGHCRKLPNDGPRNGPSHRHPMSLISPNGCHQPKRPQPPSDSETQGFSAFSRVSSPSCMGTLAESREWRYRSKNKAGYPSGLRGRIANPLFVGSNPTPASCPFPSIELSKRRVLGISRRSSAGSARLLVHLP